MPRKNLINPTTRGVNQRLHPIAAGNEFAHHATNVVFEEGRIKTRFGLRYHETGVEGAFQGVTEFRPSRGLSFKPFSPSVESIALAAGGDMFLYHYGKNCAQKVCNPVCYTGEVNLFQAENYLIAQSRSEDTTWYEGGNCMVRSPGIGAPEERVKDCMCEVEATEKEVVGEQQECCYDRIRYTEFTPVEKEEEPHSSHDTFVWSKHRNFLLNGVGLGAYVHGRIHQEGPYSIYVSDIIHARGNKSTDDVLLMEEQMLAGTSPPLSVPSKMGNLVAMQPVPAQNSANGDGDLIAYYEHGVVAFNTFQFPRETRHDGAGKVIQEGWDTKRLISVLLNSISAVGRYAVAILPRDHFFRSIHGLHFLRTSLGDSTFNDEATNIISAPVEPMLSGDALHLLRGAACGYWQKGHRVFATTGMVENGVISATPFGAGFVSWNQATTYTRDRTPINLWDGLMLPDYEIAGIHGFVELGDSFAAVCSSQSGSRLYLASLDQSLEDDFRAGESIPIEWEVVSGGVVLSGLDKIATVTDGSLTIEMAAGAKVSVEVRSDLSPEWEQWGREIASDERAIVSASLGMPPKSHKDATWIQIRITGLGYCELINAEVDYSDGVMKGGGRNSSSTTTPGHSSIDFFRLNTHPESRWP